MVTDKQKNKDSVEENTTVEEVARDFNLSIDFTLKELNNLGVKKKNGDDIIEAEYLEEVLTHFDNLQNPNADDANENKSETLNTQNVIRLETPIIVKNLAEALNKKPTEIIKKLMEHNVLASINQTIDLKVAEKVVKSFGYELNTEKVEKKQNKTVSSGVSEISEDEEPEDDPNDLVERPPAVTFLGHVDHGKTSIQDVIRKTNIVKGEAGGITQHTGASVVKHNNKDIVFIDTPGHEAFTTMRARGANVTDIVVLVIAADDGIMPQTVEAINHAKAANVPIIVAINKCDLSAADPDKVLLHMQQNNLTSENWGGDVGTIKVSAVTGEGLDDLLERILLEAEMLELKANPNKPAKGVVLESELKQGLGSTANLIVQDGTLKVGDPIICETYYGKAKTLINHKGERVKSAGPTMPVKFVGLSGVPDAGSKFKVCKTEKEAAAKARETKEESREKNLKEQQQQSSSLEDIYSKLSEEKTKELNIVIKADTHGTVEAIKDSLQEFPQDKIKVKVIHSGVGAISESDILLASASNAIVVGFHTKVNPGVNSVAKKEGVEIRLYNIIYELIEDIKEALIGKLEPDKREKKVGKARILKIFRVSKGPKVIGCLVEEGSVKVGAKARVYRKNELLYNGNIESLKRFKDHVKEVKTGQECGIRLDNFLDFQEGDIVEIYEVELQKASL